jgi:hypothetical protein
MSEVLRRGQRQPWVTKWPVSRLGTMLIAAFVGIGIFTYCNIEAWTPLEQSYWVQYLNAKPFPTERGDYKPLTKVDVRMFDNVRRTTPMRVLALLLTSLQFRNRWIRPFH